MPELARTDCAGAAGNSRPYAMPGMTSYPRAAAAGVRKTPRHEIAEAGTGGAAGVYEI